MYAIIVSWKNMYVLILNLVKTTYPHTDWFCPVSPTCWTFSNPQNIKLSNVHCRWMRGLFKTIERMCGPFSDPYTTPYGTEDCCVLYTCKTSHFMLLLALYLYLWAAWWKKYGYYIFGLVEFDVSRKKDFINKR